MYFFSCKHTANIKSNLAFITKFYTHILIVFLVHSNAYLIANLLQLRF